MFLSWLEPESGLLSESRSAPCIISISSLTDRVKHRRLRKITRYDAISSSRTCSEDPCSVTLPFFFFEAREKIGLLAISWLSVNRISSKVMASSSFSRHPGNECVVRCRKPHISARIFFLQTARYSCTEELSLWSTPSYFWGKITAFWATRRLHSSPDSSPIVKRPSRSSTSRFDDPVYPTRPLF